MTVHIRPAGSGGRYYGPHRDLATCGKYVIASAMRALQAREEEFSEKMQRDLSQAGDLYVKAIFDISRLPPEQAANLTSVLQDVGYTSVPEEARKVFERELGISFSHYMFSAVRDARSIDPMWDMEDKEFVTEVSDRMVVQNCNVAKILAARIIGFLRKVAKTLWG